MSQYLGSIGNKNDIITKGYADDNYVSKSGSTFSLDIPIKASNLSTVTINPALSSTDKLYLYYNGVLMMEGVNYRLTSTTISLLDFRTETGDIISIVKPV